MGSVRDEKRRGKSQKNEDAGVHRGRKVAKLCVFNVSLWKDQKVGLPKNGK